ncbi:MAG TPA: methylenetetrahydrofolate--tRNA-(uracil(54)-C(5))-methyltransferase (FADH(2)-oxidizing) TrmFO [Polyangia bacterium]|jgi:methylenetetrahydrofolate--tRNA-(uracil-5-)-methyltransferase
MFTPEAIVIGGGLAGCEAAWQLARRGVRVSLVEQKPARMSPAHTTPLLAELVCSNSLRSDAVEAPAGLLKAELRRAGSLIVECADATRVPAGDALAVDRHAFSRLVTTRLALDPNVRIERRPAEDLPEAGVPVIVAGGPLVGGGLAARIRKLCGDRFYFYDAIAPIVEADSIDWSRAFRGSRWGRGSDDGGDYVNCPMTTAEYRAFVEAVRAGQKVAPHAFEEPRYFEGCLPIEVMAERGDDVLAYGPMKPVGLDTDAHAVVQLRAENRWATSYNLVGFQTRLTYGEQKRIFAMIPALAQAEYLRMGSIHRNSYIESWRLCGAELELRALPHVRLAGQITGVEGYIESTAMGLVAALFAHGRLVGRPVPAPPPTTAFGALYHHLMRPRAPGEPFAPTNINFGLLPPLQGRAKKRERRALHAERAKAAFGPWLSAVA